MKRKVVRHGTATLTISLPSKWVKEHNIKPGDELEVMPKGKEIVISTEQEVFPRRGETTFQEETERAIEKTIKHYYRTGYDELKVNFLKNETLPKVKKTLNLFMGFEVVEQSAKSCLIKNISTALNLDFDTWLRKCFLLIVQEYDHILQNWSTGRAEPIEIIEQMQTDLKKFVYLCQRMLFKDPALSNEIQTSYYTILSKLSRLSSNCLRIHYLTSSQKKKVGNDTFKYLKSAQKLFIESYEAFFQQKPAALEGLDKRKTELYELFYRRIQEKNDFENVLYYYIYDNIRVTPVFSALPIMTASSEEKK